VDGGRREKEAAKKKFKAESEQKKKTQERQKASFLQKKAENPDSATSHYSPGSTAISGALNRLTAIFLSANIHHMLKIRLQRVGRVNKPELSGRSY
jgi:hypothetical protein